MTSPVMEAQLAQRLRNSEHPHPTRVGLRYRSKAGGLVQETHILVVSPAFPPLMRPCTTRIRTVVDESRETSSQDILEPKLNGQVHRKVESIFLLTSQAKHFSATSLIFSSLSSPFFPQPPCPC